MTAPNPSAIHTREFDSVFIKATNVASTATDRVAGVKDLSVDQTRAMTETVYMGEDLARSVAGVRSMKMSMSGHVIRGDAVQAVLRGALDTGTVIYLTVMEDPTATTGSQGRRYGVYVESYNEKRAQGDVISFDASFALADPNFTTI